MSPESENTAISSVIHTQNPLPPSHTENTKKQYSAKQAEWVDWCTRILAEDGAVVTEQKIVRFLQEHVHVSGNKKRNRPGVSPLTVSPSVYKAYVSAIIDLYKTQVALGINDHPHPRGNALKQFLDSKTQEDALRKREENVERAVGSMSTGSQPEKLQRTGDFGRKAVPVLDIYILGTKPEAIAAIKAFNKYNADLHEGLNKLEEEFTKSCQALHEEFKKNCQNIEKCCNNFLATLEAINPYVATPASSPAFTLAPILTSNSTPTSASKPTVSLAPILSSTSTPVEATASASTETTQSPVTINQTLVQQVPEISHAPSPTAGPHELDPKVVYKYSLSRSLMMITDIWREYETGLGGNPSVKDLEHHYGTAWRKGEAERRYFSRRKVLYDEIKRIACEKGITGTEAAALLEADRVRLGKSIDGMRKFVGERGEKEDSAEVV